MHVAIVLEICGNASFQLAVFALGGFSLFGLLQHNWCFGSCFKMDRTDSWRDIDGYLIFDSVLWF